MFVNKYELLIIGKRREKELVREAETRQLLHRAGVRSNRGWLELIHKLLASTSRFLVFLGRKLRQYELLVAKQLSRSTTAS